MVYFAAELLVYFAAEWWCSMARNMHRVAPSVNYAFSNPEMTLFVLNKKIDFIGCYEELLYKGVNLIGLSVQQFSNHIQDDYSEEDKLFVNEEGEEQYVYEFDKVGLQIWTKGKLGVIVCFMFIKPGWLCYFGHR